MIDAFPLSVRLELSEFLGGLPETTGMPAPNWGICGCVATSDISIEAKELFSRSFNSVVVKWPEFSGTIRYPVPDPVSMKSQKAAVARYQKYVKSHWSKRSRYGLLRRNLAKFLAQEVLTWGIES